MMGLLGNVAEVEYLRPRLVKSDLLETFARLLDSTSDGIEVRILPRMHIAMLSVNQGLI